jgi:hypothetical protein
MSGPGTRWAKARRLLELAEGRAFAGRPAGTAGAVARALALDPARTGAQLLYRAARLLRREGRGRRAAPVGPPFEECPVSGHIEGDAHAIGAMAGLLDRWDRRRLERIGREEEAAEEKPQQTFSSPAETAVQV